MWGYRRRLESDVRRWEERGLITPTAAEAILSDGTNIRGPSTAIVMSTLAAILLGFAAMSFVAANWQVMPKLLRFILMIVALGGCYAWAIYLLHRNSLLVLEEGAVLAGVFMFGAFIMLISQMYHMDWHRPHLLLLWGLAGLLTGWLAASHSALVAAVVLLLGWTLGESNWRQEPHLAFLPTWVAAIVGFYFQRWRPGFHVGALAFSAWVVNLQWVLQVSYPHLTVAGIGIALGLLAVFLAPRGGVAADLAPPLLGYGAAITLIGFVGSQFELVKQFQLTPVGPLLLRAATVIAILGSAIVWAWRVRNRHLCCFLITLLSVELFILLGLRQCLWLVAVVGITFVITGLAEQRLAGRSPVASAPLVSYGLIVAFIALFDLQFMAFPRSANDPRTWEEILRLSFFAVATLVLIVTVLGWATRHRLKNLTWICFALFTIEVVSLYIDTLGSLLRASLFFLIAGLILSGLSWLALKLHERDQRQSQRIAP